MKKIPKLMFVVLLWLFLAVTGVLADVEVHLLDTSGSMRQHGFEEAKQALIQKVQSAAAGSVMYIATFDISDRLLGRLAVGEDGSPAAKAQLIDRIKTLEPKGQWTNLDLAVKAGKSYLLEERTPGARRIIILSDGISDPAPGFEKMDLEKITAILPQSLGFSLYLISLPDDLSGIFHLPTKASGMVSTAEAPHIIGIPIQEFSREKIDQAMAVAREDTTNVSSPEEPSSTVTESTATQTAEGVTDKTFEPALLQRRLPLLAMSLISGAIVLTVFGVAPLVRRKNGYSDLQGFTLEILEEESKPKRVPVAFGENRKKTVGPRGDVPLTEDGLPPVVFTLVWKKGQLWLTPQDTISVNGQLVTGSSAVGIGDRIRVRDKLQVAIEEGGSNQ